MMVLKSYGSLEAVEISTHYFEVELFSHRRSAMRLTEKVALVTGAQQGIGQAIALAYGREGASVIVNYLDDQAAAEKIVSQIRGLGPQAIAVSGNVARADDIQAMIEAGKQLGSIDILVNNAGIFPRVDFLDMTEAQWEEVLGVNLKGSFLCTQAVARQLVARGQGGAVINLASGAAFRSSPRGVHYVSSKAGLVGLTRATALELAPYRIRVNAIAPGLTDTAQPRYGMTEEEIQERGREVPLGRMATPDDIADMAVFLASEEARYVTGQTLHVNGGQYLS
jgi:NAD(P)-dependent dehydrogenase (short-subunit alcohol dehydrogenase family)